METEDLSEGKIIALIGGMGPESSLRLHSEILQQTPKFKTLKTDQDHIDLIHFSLSQDLEDRTQFLLNKTKKNPADVVYKTLVGLHQLSLYLHKKIIAAVVCNTFHAPPIFDHLKKLFLESNFQHITLLNLIEEVAFYLRENFKSDTKIGILSTTGERTFHIYKSALEPFGFQVIQTNEEQQKELHRVIYELKVSLKINDSILEVFDKIIHYFKDMGVEALLLGCTELSLVAEKIDWNGEKIDPLQIIAGRLITRAIEK